MNAGNLISGLEDEGVTLTLEGQDLRYQCRSGTLTAKQKSIIVDNKSLLRSELAKRKTQPELSNLQQAYWLGEDSAFRYSAPAYVHLVYRCPEVGLALLTVGTAALMQRHPALRLQVSDQGISRFATDIAPPVSEIDINDADAFAISAIANPTEYLNPLFDGPPFRLVLVHGKDGTALHAILRLIVFDAASVGVFMDDLAAFCAGSFNTKNQPHLPLTRLQTSAGRIENFAGETASEAPTLPMLPVAQRARSLKFNRITGSLSKEDFQQLRESARRNGVSLNAVLFQIYADTLRRWSKNRNFDLNVMVSGRPVLSDTEGVIWNYSKTALVPAGDGNSFADRVKKANFGLFSVLSSTTRDGVAVMRAMSAAGLRQDTSEPVAPYVFSTQIESEPRQESLYQQLGWSMTASSMSTPQVWYDHQVFEVNGELHWNFDVAEKVLADTVVEDASEYYRMLLSDIAGSDKAWTEPSLPALPNRCLSARMKANDTKRQLNITAMHTGLWSRAKLEPDIAAFASDRVLLGFRQSAALASGLGDALKEAGLATGDRVVIHSDKTVWAAIAMFAVLHAGGVYVPVAASTPRERVRAILEDTGAKVFLSDNDPFAAHFSSTVPAVLNHVSWLEKAAPKTFDATEPHKPKTDALAYIIYTSGSTGRPKGVAITHGAAANTIIDILARFDIGKRDRLLCVSALSFDLSVFDIFAPSFGAGATVFPRATEGPDPEAWLDAVRAHGATVWNSAPPILEVMAEYLLQSDGSVWPTRKTQYAHQLRVFMASGDWIPLSLPNRLKTAWPESKFISLGGATEASIWSNYFEAKDLDPSWSSIPYGWPLTNQNLHVLDDDGNHAPPLVPGRFMISGDGLAKEYYNDPERTDSAFFLSKILNCRVYETGDVARYRLDGTVELLGRRDLQVKIRGFRVELGEIEHVLEAHSKVTRASVVLVPWKAGESELIAVVKWMGTPDSDKLLEYAQQILPSYMIPKKIITVEEIPTTPNGKMDRKKLAEIAKLEVATEGEDNDAVPVGDVEEKIAAIWSGILGYNVNRRDQRFDAAGGDSLSAIRLLNVLENEYGKRLNLSALYQHPTVEAQAALFTSKIHHKGPLVTLSEANNAAELILVHPVGGSIGCYSAWPDVLKSAASVRCLSGDNMDGPQTMDKMVSGYTDALETLNDAPLWIGGWSMGGVLAHAIGQELEKRGKHVAGILMIDPWYAKHPEKPENISLADLSHAFATDLIGKQVAPFSSISKGNENAHIDAIFQACTEAGVKLDRQSCVDRFTVFCRNYKALLAHIPTENSVIPTTVYRAIHALDAPGLRPFTGSAKNIVEYPTDHFGIMSGKLNDEILSDIATVIRNSW